MKKIFIIFYLFLFSFLLFDYSFFDITTVSADSCVYDVDNWWISVWDQLDKCLAWSDLVDWQNVAVDWSWWFAAKIKNVVYNVSLYLWILAVWSIVFWSLMLTLSAWEDDKITKAKNIIKWWLIWFVSLISASTVINLVVKIMYSI